MEGSCIWPLRRGFREDFHHNSDIDALVTFSPDAHHSLFSYDKFVSQKSLRYAIERQIMVIGEAARRVSSNFERMGSLPFYQRNFGKVKE